MKTQEVDGSAILSVEPKTSYEFPPFSHHVLFLLQDLGQRATLHLLSLSPESPAVSNSLSFLVFYDLDHLQTSLHNFIKWIWQNSRQR